MSEKQTLGRLDLLLQQEALEGANIRATLRTRAHSPEAPTKLAARRRVIEDLLDFGPPVLIGTASHDLDARQVMDNSGQEVLYGGHSTRVGAELTPRCSLNVEPSATIRSATLRE